MGALIFVVDGVPERRNLIHQVLGQAGYRVEAFATTRALEIAEQWLPALMLVAVELPDGNGVVLREKVRRTSALAATPVVLLADRRLSEYQDLINASPRDYLMSPFSAGELLVAVEASLYSVNENEIPVSIADIVIDSAAMKVFVQGREIRTTTLEFRLLEYMAKHQGKVFTRDALLDAVWGDLQFVTPRSVDACIRRIRRKIESDANAPQFLRTIRGIGYKLDANATWEAGDICSCPMCVAVRTRSKIAERVAQPNNFIVRATPLH